MSETKIHWTDYSWNPTTGCSRVSPGCEHCYAEALSLRFGWSTRPWKAQFAAENVKLHPERLTTPFAWQRKAERTGIPIRCFVNSMSDLFHEQIPDWYIYAVWEVMARTPDVLYQILTKRPERMRDWFRKLDDRGPDDVPPVLYRKGGAEHSTFVTAEQAATVLDSGRATMFHDWIETWGDPPAGAAYPLYDWQGGPRWWPTALSNVWLGVSVEDQRRANERIPLLLETPAAVRFLSCEPLLGPVDLSAFLWRTERVVAEYIDLWPRYEDEGVPDGRLHWVICGGESGPGFRPMDLDWARDLRDQAIAADVAFFFKQSAGLRPGTGRLLDGRLWEDYPGAAHLAEGTVPA